MKMLFLGTAAALLIGVADAEAQGYCREYSQGVTIGGQRQSSYGVACLQPDGSWQVVSSQQNYGGNFSYAPPPPPPVAYVPAPVPAPAYRPVSSGFSLSIGVPFHRGYGGCNNRHGRSHYKNHKHHGHGGWKHGRW